MREILLEKKREFPQPLTRAAAAKTPAMPEDKSEVHIVAAGETLSKIAQKYYGAGGPAQIRAILLANPILDKNPNQLKIGDKVIIPAVATAQ